MRPGIDFDATRRAAHTPSQTAKRLLFADAARSNLHIESCDVPAPIRALMPTQISGNQ
jgi:hypothetical protein